MEAGMRWRKGRRAVAVELDADGGEERLAASQLLENDRLTVILAATGNIHYQNKLICRSTGTPMVDWSERDNISMAEEAS
jgi:hypothetical protein